MAEEKTFADGFLFKRKEAAPDFVVGGLSLKVEEVIPFLKKHAKNGWVNLDIKQARSGNYYVELDTWAPKDEAQKKEQPKPSRPVEDDGEDVPF
jgi:hypothetical protein